MNEWFSVSDLVGLAGLPGTARGIRKMAERDGFKARKKARGKGMEYHISSLPESVRTHVANTNVNAIMVSHSDAIEPEIVPGVKTRDELADEAAEKQRVIERGLAEFARIPAGHRRKVVANARRWILQALGAFIQHHGCSRSAAHAGLSHAISTGEFAVPEWVWSQMPKYRGLRGVSPATLAKWDADFRAGGIMALTDSYGNRDHKSVFDTNEGLFRLVVGAMIRAPQITGLAMIQFIEATNAQLSSSGMPGLPVPSQRAFYRFRNRWIEENHQVWTRITNPDQWKNVYMSAAGSHSENIERPNQLWELDSTPADWMLTDGRHSVVGVIDLYLRKLKLHVSKSSTAMAVCQVHRRAMLDWGVPEAVRTDNGQDYVSDQYELFLDAMGIQHLVCIPFASEEKGTIERAMRTLSHCILNLLPGFIGHNVAERRQIEARKSFAARMMTKGEVIEVEMSAADLQQRLDDWCEHYYGNAKHSALGMSPNEKAREWTGTVRRIEDERALDMLLCEIGGVRRIGKKGIRFENHTYINDGMGLHIGKSAMLKYDEADIGRLYAYVEGRFVGVFECHEINGTSRREAAIAVKSRQKKLLAEQSAEYKAYSREIKKNIAETVLEHRIAQSENIVAMPHRSEPHTSVGLREAGRAARSGEVEARPLNEAEQEAFERLQAEDRADDARESASVSVLIEFGDDPIRNYRLYESLIARESRGETLKARERDMARAYEKSAECSAMKKFNEAE